MTLSDLLPFLLATAILAGLILYSRQFRTTEIGRAFLALMLCALVWVALFDLECVVPDLENKLVFFKLEFLGIAFVPVAWVWLVFAYTGQTVSRRGGVLLVLVPALTTAVIWTNPWHHWFLGQARIDLAVNPFPVVNPDYQFWFYFVHAPAGYVYLAVAVGVLMGALLKMDEVYRAQGRMLLLAILLPTVTDLLYVFGISPEPHVNYTTAVFSISGLILAWALFRYRLLDLIPLARDTMIQNLGDAVIVLDLKDRVVDLNPAARQICGISTAVVGRPLAEIESGFLRQAMARLSEGQPRIDLEVDGQPSRHFDVRTNPVHNPHGVRIGRVIICRDVTEREQLLRQVQALAIQDDLTGIYNRRHFVELGTKEMHRLRRSPGRSASALMIDLDYFKSVNDNFGHACGDQVLVAFAHAIKAHLRAFDIVGRWGGEEFAVLLLDVAAGEAVAVAERIRTSVQELRIVEGVAITASIGVVSTSQVDEADLEIERLLDLADQALYQAKAAGRNRVVAWERTMSQNL